MDPGREEQMGKGDSASSDLSLNSLKLRHCMGLGTLVPAAESNARSWIVQSNPDSGWAGRGWSFLWF